jgi:preprotein translocase subunit SecG
MYNVILFLHVVVIISLIAVILVQRGRSGGLVEALGGVESIFGTKTNSFFVKITVTLAILFFITSISLAYLSKERAKSLVDKYSVQESTKEDQKVTPKPVTTTEEESLPEDATQ